MNVDIFFTSLGLQAFRSLLKLKRLTTGIVIFQLHKATRRTEVEGRTPNTNSLNLGNKSIMEAFNTMFRDEMHDGLPTARSVDHQIESKNDCKLPHRPMFQFYQAKL